MNNDQFDFNYLGKILGVLGLDAQQKVEIAQEIQDSMRSKLIAFAGLDETDTVKMIEEKNTDRLIQILAEKVEDKAAFVAYVEQIVSEVIAILISDFVEIATDEQKQELEIYLDDYTKHFDALLVNNTSNHTATA